MKRVLAEMARLYREHAFRLKSWMEEQERLGPPRREDSDATHLIERLSDIDGQFFEAARFVGDRVEEGRKSVHAGMGGHIPEILTLRKAAEMSDAVEEFEAASAAVADVSVLHVRAVRQLENLQREITSEMSEISRTQKVKSRYNSQYAKGRRLSGRA